MKPLPHLSRQGLCQSLQPQGLAARRPATLCCRDAQKSTNSKQSCTSSGSITPGLGVTVTESKFLHDPDLGEREVDIFVEAEADGDPIVISIEVNEPS